MLEDALEAVGQTAKTRGVERHWSDWLRRSFALDRPPLNVLVRLSEIIGFSKM